jgi:phosphatidylglycerophosphate synthase
VLAATAVAGATQNPWPLLVVGGGLLLGLVVVAWNRWTPQGGFGLANGVTMGRLVLLGGLPATTGAGPVIGLGLLFLAADGLDGWIARRRDCASTFGAFLDKELDALFLLVLCAIAAFEGHVGLWVLGTGLLRYVFVVALFLLDPPSKTEDRSSVARYVYGGMVGALLLTFLPYPNVFRPVLYIAAAALTVSFGRSFWRMIPRRQPLGDV